MARIAIRKPNQVAIEFVMPCKLFLTIPVLFLSTNLLCGDETAFWPQYGGRDGNYVLPFPEKLSKGEAVIWRRPLGPGTSQIVSDGKLLFSMYSIPDPKESKQGEEIVIAMDRDLGKTIWENRTKISRLPKQETFSGDPVRPQATPTLANNRLCTLGYTGLLKCFLATTGKVNWEIDLVKEFGATPVQFGFSGSPIVSEGYFVVPVGGKQSALIAFEIESGKVGWKSESAEPAYSTPVLGQLGGITQFVHITRDAILGIEAKSGRTLWTYPMPKAGLTNVPTPIILSDDRILVSGQGILGTRLLKITKKSEKLEVSEIWKNEKETFFYCNWIVQNNVIYGNYSKFFGAINLSDGKELWRERGFENSNILKVGESFIVLRGDGQLSRCVVSQKGIELKSSTFILKGRCWTAPSLVGDTIYARDDKEIVAIRLAAIAGK